MLTQHIKRLLIAGFTLVILTAVAGPALADCTTTSNGSGNNYYCTDTTTLVDGTPRNDHIDNQGHIIMYMWSGGFSGNSTQSDFLINNGTIGEGLNDDGLWGSAGNDTLINNGVVVGGTWTIWNGVPGTIFGDDSLGVSDDDIIIHNGISHGNIHGDYSAGGDDSILINGQVNGGVYGEGPESVTFGNDLITVTNNAVITDIIDGMGGVDTLQFDFSTADEAVYNTLFDHINASDPASGSLTFNGNVFNWINFEILENSIELTVPPTIAVYLAGTDALEVSEDGATDSYTLVLASPPSANVMITVTPDAQCLVNGSSAPVTLTFTRTGATLWSNPQTVTIGATDDGVIEADHSCTVSHSIAAGSAGEYLGTSIGQVSADITDNDSAGIAVSAISGDTNEWGATATFTMVLTSQPTADVTVDLSSSNPAEGTVAPESVTFTLDNWDSPQTVTVTGVDDGLEDGDVSYSIITAPAVSADQDYHGIDPDDVTVLNLSLNSPTATHTPTNTPTDTPTFTPTYTPTATIDPADPIFMDGFESGNTAAWSLALNDGNDLTVSTAAALVGSQGLHLDIDDNTGIGVRDDTPDSESRYRARFYFDPNSISMANGNRHLIFVGANLTAIRAQVEFGRNGGVYQIRAGVVSDSNVWSQTNWFTITDAPHAIEIDWWAATGPGANNGGLTLWLDGQQVANVSGIDNDAQRIELVALGPVFGVNSGTRGSYYLDAFESRRQTYIGLVPTEPAATPTHTPTNTPIPTDTPTDVPTATWTPTETPVPTETPIPSETATDAPPSTPTDIPTETPIPTETYTPIPSETPVPTETHTPTDIPTYTPTADAADPIFMDGFESGNTAAWSLALNDGNDLTVSTAAALVGSQGLHLNIDDNTGIGVRDDTPDSESRYRARFYFDPNSISMANGNRHLIFIGANLTAIRAQVEFGRNGGVYQIRAGLTNDANATINTGWFTITDAPHAIEIDWWAATGPGANNGGLTLWLDGQQVANVSGIDNDAQRIELAALGPVFGVNSGTRGSYYLDAFESRRQTYIGPVPTEPAATPTDIPTETPIPTETHTPIPSDTPTDVPTATPTDIPTETPVPTDTPIPTATWTPTETPVPTETPIPSDTPTDVPTATPTDIPTETPIPTETHTPIPSETPTDAPTATPTDIPTETPIPTETHTPTDIPTYTPTATIDPADQIFMDGFESGNTAAWSLVLNDGNDVSVSPAAALVGSQGLHLVINDNTGIGVRDDTPDNEARYRARFYFDPNSISMANGNRHLIFIGANLTAIRAQVEFGRNGGSYEIRAAAVSDSNVWSQTNWFTITDAPHAIEIDWWAATGPGANNGGLTLWLDGQQVANVNGIDNDTQRIELAALGPVFGVNSATRGSYYLDAFESRRQTYIGLAATEPAATPTDIPTETPIPTDTPTDVPTETPIPSEIPADAPPSTPTDIPTETPIPTETYTPIPSETPVPTETHTPTAIPTYTPTATADLTDPIFADGFESGNTAAWSLVLNDGNDVSVSPAAALVGSQGLHLVINDNTGIGVRDDTPDSESRYRARFYFDPNSISMANGNRHLIFIGANLTAIRAQVEFGRNGGSYQIRAALTNDSNALTHTNWFTITDAPHAIEIDWWAATGPGANNGGLTLWLDGQQVANISGIDNDTQRVELAALGPVFGVNSGTRGSYYLDAFESRRHTYIGLAPIEPMAMQMHAPIIVATEIPADNPTLSHTPTDAPTETPVTMPTETATATLIPTDMPTDVPTATWIPTEIPTEVPTSTPIPTDPPTAVPTAIPIPTDVPTSAPIPTDIPTEAPPAPPDEVPDE